MLLGALALPVALLALGRSLTPDPRGFGTHEQLGFQPCLPMRQWNVPCPGCGVTTSIVLVAHGRPLAALATQPLGPIALACAFAAAVWAAIGHARGRDLALDFRRASWRQRGSVLVALGALAWMYKLALVRGWLGP